MAVTDVEAELERVASDPALDPAERIALTAALREHRDDQAGYAARLRGDREKLREADAAELVRRRLMARELADIREALILDGDDPASLDAAGYLSHAELDRLEEEELLVEALAGLEPTFNASLHMRGRGGKFRVMPDHVTGNAHQAYFNEDPKAQMIHVGRLKPGRADPPEHIAKARAYLDQAKAGQRHKRQPIDVRDNGDGTFTIIDGNSTYSALKDELTHIPAIVRQGGPADDEIHRVAGKMEKTAAAAEPVVTETLKTVVSARGGKLVGLDHRLKTHESLVSKIQRKQEKYPGMDPQAAAGRIQDALRYTAVFPSSNYTRGVIEATSALATEGYKVVDQKNYWGGDDDYDGYHAIMRGPAGLVELQFHTPDSLDVKEKKLHPIFEKFRVSHDPHERWQLWTEMTAVAKTIPQPPGVDQLRGHTEHDAPIEIPGQPFGGSASQARAST